MNISFYLLTKFRVHPFTLLSNRPFNNNNNNNNNNMFKQDDHFSYKNCYQYGSCYDHAVPLSTSDFVG